MSSSKLVKTEVLVAHCFVVAAHTEQRQLPTVPRNPACFLTYVLQF